MLDDALLRAFEQKTIDPPTFRHREHLYVAWRYLRAMPVEDALAKYVRHLRELCSALGAPEKFHATITWAYVVLLHAAMELSPNANFDELLALNPDLLDHATGALHAVYDRRQLDTDEARRRFVLPRRG